MSDDHDDDWYARYKEKQDALRKNIKKLTRTVEKLTERIRSTHAEMLMDNLKGNPEKQKAFVDKLYNPFYTPTVVEEIVIQKLLEKEKDGQDL